MGATSRSLASEPLGVLARLRIRSRSRPAIIGDVMFDFHNLSTALTLLKILVGLSLFAETPIFFFKLLTSRFTFIKGNCAGRSVVRALIPDPDWVGAAFEEIKPARPGGQSRAGAKTAELDPSQPIFVEIAADGSFRIDIPDSAFDLVDARRS
jgi:hypothetical protein